MWVVAQHPDAPLILHDLRVADLVQFEPKVIDVKIACQTAVLRRGSANLDYSLAPDRRSGDHK